MKECVILLTVLFQFSFGQIEKSSLTFVIDDTGSMGDDIQQVKNGVNLIFDTVMNSNASQIKNFVLLTFNDPTYTFRTNTQSRTKFKSELDRIIVTGGGDCPEMSMTGIYQALIASEPGSYIYVFTDASAKDSNKVADVKSKAIEMNSQVVFLLTGRCSMNDDDPQYQAYYTLAEATSGQVFHMGKQDVKKILNYIVEQIKTPKTVITSKKFPPGPGHNLTFPVDSDMKTVIIAGSGDTPTIDVRSPDGTKPETKTVVDIPDVKAVRIDDTMPGNYTAIVGSKSETSVVVSASTSIKFQHGFSGVQVPNIETTVTTPISGETTFLSIKLVTPDDDKIINSVELMDIMENIVSELPLTLLDKKDKFYSTEGFLPPEHLFKVAVKGIDTKNNATFRRVSSTPVEVQRPKPGVSGLPGIYDGKSPVVQAVGGPKITAEFNESLKIACKVSAYPKPDVIWVGESGVSFTPPVSIVKLPYDYIVIMEIDNVTKNSTYTCKASNTHGANSASVEVETMRKEYFNIIEVPKDTTIEYGKSENLNCKIDAFPPAEISWFANDTELHTNEYFVVSDERSVLTVKNMQVKFNGSYFCVAKNYANLVNLSFKILLTGFEKPEIDQTSSVVHGIRGNDTEIICKITKGLPKPAVTWYFKESGSRKFVRMNETDEVLLLNNLDFHHNGVYGCHVVNDAGQDFHQMTVVVDFPPYIEKSKTHVRSRHGEPTTLWCAAHGEPTPKVTWLRNGVEMTNDREHHIFRDHSLRFKGSRDNSGNFTCIASNSRGTATRTVQVDYVVPVSVEPPKQSFLELEFGSRVSLPCRADGYPRPTVKWIFFSDTTKKSIILRSSDPSGLLELRNLQPYHDGYYTCVARNIYSNANITYQIKVLAKPFIHKSEPRKTYSVVTQDLVLKIPCQATGNPKPDITWTRNGLNIAAGTEWYDIEDDGTLVVKNIDDASGGIYVCQARNKVGEDSEVSNVVVRPFPDTIAPADTVNIQENSTADLTCGIPHSRLDYIRWYKDGRLFAERELTLRNVKRSDGGIYTCRVSTFLNSTSSAVSVVVGSPPAFVDDLDEYDLKINYEDSIPTFLDCQAYGEPVPEVIWMHNGKKISFTEMLLEFEMSSSTRGQYDCIVKNNFGSIRRTFEIISRECFLNVQEDFTDRQPLMVEPSFLQLSQFENSNGFIRISPEEGLLLYCPSGFTIFPRTEVIATCDGDTNFKIEGNTYKFSELMCREEVIPQIKRTGRECRSRNSETVKIGFEFRGDFLDVYEICYDKENNIPVYAKNRVPRSIADGAPKVDSKWLSNELLNLKLDEIYDCEMQIRGISSQLRRWFHSEDDHCCFNSGKLVDPADLPVGLPQKAAFTSLNVVPHWSTCGAQNWDLLEKEIRNLAKSSFDDLVVWTGTSGQLELDNAMSTPQKISLTDSVGGEQGVPEYLWKVIWMHNGKKISFTEMLLEFEMSSSTRGQYDCIVKNNFGSIRRTFEIISRECFLNVQEDFTDRQPLMVEPSFLQLSQFENSNGFIRISPEEGLLLYCPSGFTIFPRTEVIATCDGDTNFKIEGNTYKFSELMCREEVIPQIKRTGRECRSRNSETVKIGFEFRGDFLDVYEICYDKENNIPVYAKNRVPRSIADGAPKVDSKWLSNELLNLKLDEIYDCEMQIRGISSQLRRWFHSEDDHCCFNSGKLVDPADLPVGLPQKAAFTSLNVVPHWSTCGAQNWDLLEKEIRNLAKSSFDDLVVWTGTSGQLELDNAMSTPQKISLTDSVGGEQGVPEYLWKVVQNPATKSSLAIVQLNIPDVTLPEAFGHMVCRDICRDIPWMAEQRSWRDPAMGFTFCCTLQEFERAFNFEGLFGDNLRILNIPSLPKF